MTSPFIYHGQSRDWVTKNEGSLTLILATEKCYAFEKVMVRHEPDNEEVLAEMTPCRETSQLQYWQATIALNSDRDITHYVFKLLCGTVQYWLDGKGLSHRVPGKETHFKYNTQQQPPEWVSEQVFYQIFPDRFCNGKPEIDRKSVV